VKRKEASNNCVLYKELIFVSVIYITTFKLSKYLTTLSSVDGNKLNF